MDIIPIDLLEYILEILGPKDLINSYYVCKKWNYIISVSRYIWVEKIITHNAKYILKHFPISTLKCYKSLTNKDLIKVHPFIQLNPIKTLYLYKNHNITDEYIQQLTSLTELNCIGNDIITANSIKYLTSLTTLNYNKIKSLTDEIVYNLTNITYLNCSSSRYIKDLHIQSLNSLKYLKCSCTNVSNQGIENLTNLTTLDCRRCSNITDYGLQKLRLSTLYGNSNMTNKSLFSQSKSLTFLHGNNMRKITDLGMESLENLNYLSLVFSKNDNFNVTDKSIAKLSNLKTLRCFSEYCRITDRGITNLKLEELICGNKITDFGIINMTTLKSLNCERADITNYGISNLSSLTDLNCNNIICDQNIADLQLIGLCCGNRITDLGIIHNTRLQELDITRTTKVTDNCLKILTTLAHLRLYNNQGITDDGIGTLLSLTRLYCTNDNTYPNSNNEVTISFDCIKSLPSLLLLNYSYDIEKTGYLRYI